MLFIYVDIPALYYCCLPNSFEIVRSLTCEGDGIWVVSLIDISIQFKNAMKCNYNQIDKHTMFPSNVFECNSYIYLIDLATSLLLVG